MIICTVLLVFYFAFYRRKYVPIKHTEYYDKLVDEYMESLDIPDNSLMKKLVPMAKVSYKKFAEFIYNHK